MSGQINKTDGKFIIQNGDGITQGIQKELGLSNQECKQLGSIWTQIINEFDGETNGQANMTVTNNRDKTANSSSNYFVYANAIVEFSKECWQRIVNLVNNALNKNIEVEETTSEINNEDTLVRTEQTTNNTELTPLIQSRMEKHKSAVEEAVSIIEKNWNISGLGEKFKTEEDKQLYLNCLKEVVYDAKTKGAGHAEMGVVHIETNNDEEPNVSDMLKLLIHEANHAFKQRKVLQNGGLNYPTKAEEIECETLALTTTSKLINAGLIDDYEIYGQNVSEYTSESVVHNNSEFQNWLNGYCQLADNLNGDITVANNPYVDDIEGLNSENMEIVNDNDTIMINGTSYKVSANGQLVRGSDTGRQINITHDCQIKVKGKVYNLSFSDMKLTEAERPNIKIKGGDILKIEGQEFVIGRDRMLEGNRQTSLMQVIVHHSDFSTPTGYGYLEFDDVKLTQQEKEKLKKEVPGFHYENMRKVPFVVVQADGTEHTGICYLP